jgi:nucleoside-triphosphatase THEP1
MITIVTGNINSGKTTKMIHLYEKDLRGGGIVSTKNMHGSLVHSYEAMNLINKENRPLMLHQQFADFPIDNKKMIGPYIINQATIKWIENVIIKLINEKMQPLYIDEIGMLELSGDGFHELLLIMLKSRLDIVMSIRSDLLNKVIEHYNIKDYKIIELN